MSNVGWPEIMVVLLIALFVVGPERLPGVAAEAGKGLRELRAWVKGMTNDLKAEMPELAEMDLASLHPKTFIRKNLWDDPDPTPAPATVALTKSSTATAGVARGSLPLEPGELAPWDPETT